MVANLDRIMKRKKAMLLSLDQGLEHGPKIFNTHTIDTEYLLNIALEGGFTGVVMHAGLAERYHVGAFRDVPLIIKLNGRSELSHMNPVSKQICSVDRAVKLGADAVGYTIYDGSPAEAEMFAEFGRIVERAHDYGIPVIAWMYPRGPGVEGHTHDTDVIAYGARIGLELGADFVKVKYNQDPAGFNWVVKSAGRTRVIVADSQFSSEEDILKQTQEVMNAGATGIAFGRTIWQHPRPLSLAKALQGIIFKQMEPHELIQKHLL